MFVAERPHMELLEAHLDWCRQRNLRPGYIESRRRNIEQLGVELGINPDLASEALLRGWYEEITERVSPPARAVMLSHATNYYRWLVREYHRSDDPTLRLVRPRLSRRLPRPIREHDLARAFQTADARVRPWLYLAAYSGLRACEIAHLRAEDIRSDLDPPMLLVDEGKGDKPRVVPLHPEVLGELRRFGIPARGFVFQHWYKPGRPPRPWNVSHACNVHLHQLGISDTLHQCRHYFGTAVYELGQDLRLTQELMGHADPVSTAGYAAWNQRRGYEVVSRIRVTISPTAPARTRIPE